MKNFSLKTFFPKVFILLFCFTFLSNNSYLYGQCPSSSVHLKTQLEVDNFVANYPLCTELNLLRLGDDSNPEDITDISGLNYLVSIKTLVISFTGLTNLNGLETLTSFENELNIFSNPALVNLNGLENISSVGGDFKIIKNTSLLNLNGLENISSVGGVFQISNNSSLLNLNGLESISSVGGDFQIFTNTSLLNLKGLENITVVDGSLRILNIPTLTSLKGLENLTVVNGTLAIFNNPLLANLAELGNLNYIEGNLAIGNNSSLTNLDGLQNITSTHGSIQINKNFSLINLYGLHNITSINGRLIILDNALLNNIDAVQNIDPTSIIASTATIAAVMIRNNPNLSICNIQSVCDFMAIPNSVVFFEDNAAGCLSQTEVKDACCPAPMFKLPTDDGIPLYCFQAEAFIPQNAILTNNEIGYCNYLKEVASTNIYHVWNNCDGGFIVVEYKTNFGGGTMEASYSINVLPDTKAPFGNKVTIDSTILDINDVPKIDELDYFKDYIANHYTEECGQVIITVLDDSGEPECTSAGTFEKTFGMEVSDECGNITDTCSVTFRGTCNPLYCTLSQDFYAGTTYPDSLFGMSSVEVLFNLIGDGMGFISIGSEECGLEVNNPACVQNLLQGSGQSISLPVDFTFDCNTSMENNLVNQVLTTILNIRYNELLNPSGSLDFGNFQLAATCMNIPGSILNDLPSDPTVNDLIDYANGFIGCQCTGTCSSYNVVMADLAGIFLGLNSRFLNCQDSGPIGDCNGEVNVADMNEGIIEMVNQSQLGPMDLFPNPASNEVTVRFSKNENEIADVLIYNNMGQLVYKKSAVDSKITIDFSEGKFTNGIYIVSIRRGKRMDTKRLMIFK